MFSKRQKLVIGLVCVLIVSATMVGLFTLSNRSEAYADLADRLIIRSDDLNSGGAWLVKKDLGPPIFPGQDQNSFQFGQFFYHDISVSEMLTVWNNTESGARSLHDWQNYEDNLTLSGLTQRTENVSVGDYGFIVKKSTNTWEVDFIRGNVTVSLQFIDNTMGFQLNNDERYLYEVSMAVSLVQDLKILAYQSSNQNS